MGQYKDMDPMEFMFPDLEPIFKAVEEFFHNVAKMLKPPHFHIDPTKTKHHNLPKWQVPQHKAVPAKTHAAVPRHDPFADMFKMFKPHHQQQHKQMPVHHQQQPHFAHWGQMRMPQSNWGQVKMPNPHFEHQKYDF